MKKKGLMMPMEESVFEITAQEVAVEVTDAATGKVYRRVLPIEYYENANGVSLRGENRDGSVSQMVFYTPRGLERLNGLTGKGPDEDPCGSHK